MSLLEREREREGERERERERSKPTKQITSEMKVSFGEKNVRYTS